MLTLNELWKKDRRFRGEVRTKLKENKQMTEEYAKKAVYDEWLKAEIEYQKMLERDAAIQNLMDTRHIPRTQAEEMYKAIQEREKDKLAKEKINNLHKVARQFEDTSEKMSRQAAIAREQAVQAALQEYDAEAENHLVTVAKMESFKRTFKGMAMRVNNCAVQLEAIQDIAKIPAIMQSINSILEICGNLDTLQFEMQNFGQVMESIDKMLLDIEAQLNPIPADTTNTYMGSDKFNKILEAEKRAVRREVNIRMGGNEDPMSNPAGNNNFADSDSVLDMIKDEKR